MKFEHFVFPLFVVFPHAVVSTGMPDPEVYSGSFASSLWNTTRFHRALLERGNSYRLRQHQEPKNAPSPPATANGATTPVAPPPPTSQQQPKHEDSTTSATTRAYSVLTDYLARLESRLTYIEQQNQKLISSASSSVNPYAQQLQANEFQQPPAPPQQQLPQQRPAKNPVKILFEGFGLLLVTALPLLVFGALIGLSLVVATHAMEYILDDGRGLTKILENTKEKIRLAIVMVTQFFMHLFNGQTSPHDMDPKF